MAQPPNSIDRSRRKTLSPRHWPPSVAGLIRRRLYGQTQTSRSTSFSIRISGHHHIGHRHHPADHHADGCRAGAESQPRRRRTSGTKVHSSSENAAAGCERRHFGTGSSAEDSGRNYDYPFQCGLSATTAGRNEGGRRRTGVTE